MMQDYVAENGKTLIEKKENVGNEMLSRLREYAKKNASNDAGKEDK